MMNGPPLAKGMQGILNGTPMRMAPHGWKLAVAHMRSRQVVSPSTRFDGYLIVELEGRRAYTILTGIIL